MQNKFFKFLRALPAKLAGDIKYLRRSIGERWASFTASIYLCFLSTLHSIHRVIKSPAFQAVLVILCIGLIATCTLAQDGSGGTGGTGGGSGGSSSSGGALGVSGGGNTIDKVLKDLFKEFYDKYRLPLVGVILFIALIQAATDDQNGIKRATKTVIVAAAVALIPSIIKLIGTLTGTQVS